MIQSRQAILVHQWQRPEALTKETIVATHQPPGNYRISPSRYPAGTSFSGYARGGYCYVLHGCWKFILKVDVVLKAGEYAELPDGKFNFCVVGNEDVDLVRVWLLPEEFRKP